MDVDVETEARKYVADESYMLECREWLSNQFDTLTDENVRITVSEWAESTRYLPATLTSMPGYYSFDVTPYLREIADCFSLNSSVREVAIKKGVQLGLSVGVIENAIGYEIEHVKKSACMLVTADQELAQTVMDTRVIVMLQTSNLDHLIMSSDEKNTRRTGRTAKKLEWKGGGFLLPLGANSPGKLRSMSISRLFFDEVDAFPLKLKNEGDPITLAKDRTATFEETRKIGYISTPLVSQTSKIDPLYLTGDQRKYFVPCKHCHEMQELKWSGTNDDGTRYGIIFDLDDDGNLDESSVGYVCPHCGAIMKNHDKTWLLSRGEWRPTAKAKRPNFRSYHISSLYSPAGMQSWTELCRKWLAAWDINNNRPKDVDQLQTFYNLVLGETFEVKTDALRFDKVVMHRRAIYSSGQIPNTFAETEAGSPVLALTCAVDVHKNHLDVQVIGWCEGRRFYSIEWLVLEGNCTDLENPDAPWQLLREIIENRIYTADDGKRYKIQLTLVDSGYNTDIVLQFCSDYSQGVYPIQGRDSPTKSAKISEFSQYTTKLGTLGFMINTNIYKDRLSNALRKDWNDVSGKQPVAHPNFPQDYPDTFFKQLTVEYKAERKNKTTGQSMGFYWHRPGNADNHSWDLTVYNSAAFDLLAFEYCIENFGMETVDWRLFYESAKDGLYYE
jgi:phage terminase large subunit GpA-like protein